MGIEFKVLETAFIGSGWVGLGYERGFEDKCKVCTI